MKAFLLFFLTKKGERNISSHKKNQDLIKNDKIFIVPLKIKKPESKL
jgi:hypothetical protein